MGFDFDEFEELLNEDVSLPVALKESNLPIFTPSDFSAVINQVFDQKFGEVLVEGEVANLKVNQKKFVFFDIKDQETTLNCFMMIFAMRFPIEDGMRVVITAQPKITQWGKFSLTVKNIKPIGEGSLKRSFDILKDKLTREGLFDDSRKRELPPTPQKIAVISSTQAAGYADFIKILNERWGGLNIQVAHTQVQGSVAADQIIRAIHFFNHQRLLPDVIVIVRGGGSADDLSSFNDENLVRAIAGSRIPILTGIGHEVDESLADLAADLAASTPSNAAQFLTPNKHDEIRFLHSKLIRTKKIILENINNCRQNNISKIQQARDRIIEQIVLKRQEVQQRIKIIEALNPQKVLQRGYALLRGQIEDGQKIEIETFNEIIIAEVKNVRTK